MATTEIVLTAPLSGVIVPLDDVPDPVFAARMVGDGLSIDPTTQSLQAPCAGAVTMIHAAGHALTVAHDSGLEVLMHIGLDTIALKGQGFTPKVKVGDRVTPGQPLIEFDADQVARKAKSLLTEIIVLPPDRIASLHPSKGPIERGAPLLTVHFKSAATTQSTGPSALSLEVTVPNPQGLHARPAAVLAGIARRFQCDTTIRRGDTHANVKSVVALMTMQVKKGERVAFEAHGPDAQEAVAALAEALEKGLGEDLAHAPTPTAAAEQPRQSDDPNHLLGVTASPGLAVGQIFQVRRQERHLNERAADPAAERRALQAALDHAVAELDDLERRSGSAIFAAHRELLQDPDVTDLVWRDIASGKSAAFAWHQACTNQAALLAALPDALLSARANDVRDVRDRVLRLLLGEAPAVLELPPNAVVVAEDLTPSETASLDRSKVVGFATLLGGPTSHVAILARSLDLPALAAVDPRAADVPDGTAAILDATGGALRIRPTPEQTAEADTEVQRLRERRDVQFKQAAQHAVTTDGHRIEVVANLGDVSEADTAVSNGAEGVGLLRSEFLFMDRPTAPTEEEQADAYMAVARTLGPERRLLIRTMDIGGDKPLPYLPLPPEANPFLGERGIRVSLRHEDLFRAQLRAILKAAHLAKLGIMLPMVTSLSELQAARAILDEVRKQVYAPEVPLGVMIEVPAAALTADVLAREAAFFSIGTNDLTQYTLAVDRGHPRLAAMADALHPAVLRLIRMTADAGKAHQKMVGICGGIAGDPQAIPLLLGLGVEELSVAVPAVPAVKAAIRELNMEDCRKLADKALTLDSAEAVRRLVG